MISHLLLLVHLFMLLNSHIPTVTTVVQASCFYETKGTYAKRSRQHFVCVYWNNRKRNLSFGMQELLYLLFPHYFLVALQHLCFSFLLLYTLSFCCGPRLWWKRDGCYFHQTSLIYNTRVYFATIMSSAITACSSVDDSLWLLFLTA